MSEPTNAQYRRWLARARTLESKSADLFCEMEDALGEDHELIQFPSAAMTSCRELVSVLGGRDND